MAKQPKNAKKPGTAPVAGNVGGVPDEQRHADPVKGSPAATPAPAVGGPRPTVAPPIPTQDVEEDDELEEDEEYEDDEDDKDEDEDDSDEDDDEDESEEDEAEGDEEDEGEAEEEDKHDKIRYSFTVSGAEPEVRSFLRGLFENSAAGHAFADFLTERGDPRDECVKHVMMAQPVMPACKPPWYYDVNLVATNQWTVKLQRSRLIAYAYPGTLLAKAMRRRGYFERYGYQVANVRLALAGRTAESVLAAFERVRRTVVFKLFGLTDEELRRPDNEPVAVRVKRHLRSLRRRPGAVSEVCVEIEEDDELRDALLAALSKDERGRAAWVKIMDKLNPDWRRQVAFKPAK